MYLILPLLLILGCSAPEESHRPPYQEIMGRTEGPLYRIRIPASWARTDPEENRTDTKVALTEFFIEDQIKVTLHNFPNMRIPPLAQIARWKQQIENLNHEKVIPQSFSGYAGFLFEGGDDEKTVLGWALQLETILSQEMGADITIKVTGPNPLMDKHNKEIIETARSFELIQEL